MVQREGAAPWVSLATGLQPEHHGVWMAAEPWAGGLRPISRASWRAPPLWAILEGAGVSTGSVAWPASRPGAAWPGVHIDDEWSRPTGRTAEAWALPLETAPACRRDALAGLRTHPTDITAETLRGLVPDLDRIDQARDATLPALAMALAEAATIQAGALWQIREVRPRVLFVHHFWLGEVRRLFEAVTDPLWGQVVPGAFRFLDGLIAGLRAAGGPDALILLASPGWRRRPGVLLAAGPGVEAGGDVLGADILDVAPTLLSRLGLSDDRLPGRLIPELAAAGGAPLAPAPRVDMPPEAAADADLLAQAQAWGYPPPPAPPTAWRAIALGALAALVLPRDPVLAGTLAAQALETSPADVTALRVRASAVALDGDVDELPALAEALRAAAPDRGWADLAQGACHVLREQIAEARPLLRAAETDPDPETLMIVATAWLAAGRALDAERVFNAVVAIDPAHVQARLGLVLNAMDRRDYLAAEALLGRIRKDDPAAPGVYFHWARLCLATARPDQARRLAALARRFGADPEAMAAAGLGDPA